MLETEKELQKFVKYVIQQSRSNLTNLKKNSSKKLYNSIKGESKLFKNSFGVYFSMEDYGHYQDKGVNGLKKNQNSQYSFKKGVPSKEMLQNLDKWIMRKGIAPRNKQGKFVNRTSLKFAIAKSIFNKGIKPSLFFTKPFERAFNKLPSELVEKYGLDAISLFNSTIEQPKVK
jgi:hypothetical protein